VALAGLAVAGAAATVPSALPDGGRADGACAVLMSHHGAPYLGHAGDLRPADLRGRAGTGVVPGCNDVIGPEAPTPAPDTIVPLRRIAGVAPRFAVGMPLGADVVPMVRSGVPCTRDTVAATLACLRATTRRLLRGPSLVAPLSAPAGGTIRIALRLPGRRPAAPAGPVVLQAAGPPPGAIAGPLVRSGRSVVLPHVPPGGYRLVTLARRGGAARGVVAPITIR
jgi:hypothetical protein